MMNHMNAFFQMDKQILGRIISLFRTLLNLSHHSNFELLTRNKAADFTDVLVFNLKCKGIEIFDNFVIA